MAKITIDELAVMMQKEFSSLHEEIQGVRVEFKAELKREIGSVRADIRRLQEDITDIRNRLERLEKRTMEDDNALAKEVVDLRRRVNILEKEILRLR